MSFHHYKLILIEFYHSVVIPTFWAHSVKITSAYIGLKTLSFHIHSRHSMVIPLKNVAEWYFSTFLGMMGMGLEWWFQSFEAHSHHSHHSYHSKFQGHSGFHSFHFGLIPSFGAHSNSFEKQKTMAICRNEKGMRDWSRMVSLEFWSVFLLNHVAWRKFRKIY